MLTPTVRGVKILSKDFHLTRDDLAFVFLLERCENDADVDLASHFDNAEVTINVSLSQGKLGNWCHEKSSNEKTP